MNARRTSGFHVLLCCVCLLATVRVAGAESFFFSTGNVTNAIASASRPGSASGFEIETGDDFIISSGVTTINSATFTGLLLGPIPSIADIVIEIYRVFPLDSDVNRTSGPPLFSTNQVPTRMNSPSDVELVGRDLSSGDLSVTTNLLNPSFTALNSLQPGGIHPAPNVTTGGDGPITGQEVQFNVAFNLPFVLPPDHYFFVPQVRLTNGTFYWLSGTRPIVAPGTPFAPDLQAWARDAFLEPDWLRIGTDIVGGSPAPTFNMAFTLNGTVPEPGTLALVGLGFAATMRRLAAKRIRRG